MGEKMPIEKLRDRLRELSMRDEAVTNTPDTLARWADIVDTHITQPTQAVDVAERIRAKLPTISASTGNPLFDAGTHDACEKIEALLASIEKEKV